MKGVHKVVGPTSLVVLIGVLLIAVGLLVAVAMSGQLAIKIVAGVMTLVVTTFWGALVVNKFYGYYTTWGAAVADLSGNGNNYALHEAQSELRSHGTASGKLVSMRLAGARSGINRDGLVYLPPQYNEPAFRSVRFPVVELLHGTPGDPGNWVDQMRIVQTVTTLLEKRQIGPMVLVMPDSNGGLSGAEECVDGPHAKDDTYIAGDVRTDIEHRFRVSLDPTQWGVMGYSSGGYCAANLALRHRTDFGAFASMDGYYEPNGQPAAVALGGNHALELANNPLEAVLAMRPGAGPLPAGWVSAGTGNGNDYRAGKAFVAALSRLESVPFDVQRGAHHMAASWRRVVPPALSWMWQQLASPAQHALFPTGGHGRGSWTGNTGTAKRTQRV